jgi:deoxyribodipyrimidine photolyase-related protein
MRGALIYPHQLHAEHPALNGAQLCVLVEDPLFFRQYSFHVQKMMLHRGTMQLYATDLRSLGHTVRIATAAQLKHTGDIAPLLKAWGVTSVVCCDVNDDWLSRRLTQALAQQGLPLTWLPDPHFLTSHDDFAAFARDKPKLFFTEFYIRQRQRLGVLVDSQQRPLGGKWSFDTANRRKLPRGCSVPRMARVIEPQAAAQLATLVGSEFAQSPGESDTFQWPVTRAAAQRGLTDFLDHRFASFGDYEDAMHPSEPFLFHALLTPALNVGLLTPQEVIDAALLRADEVPLNALEGFVRQVLGWREYIRGVYHHCGPRQRTGNFWQHTLPMPEAFYSGTTGIEPVDVVIGRVLKYAWCHHIERLMVLGNFMLLCEIAPDAVYRWFMEMFIDAYDWVMVPNVYGMSQFADGGRITTKPYLSGSSYILKMSHFPRGPWCEIWDALYWRFMNKHRHFFARNPRLAVMVHQLDRMGDRLPHLLKVANRYLDRLHGGLAQPAAAH